MPLFGNALAGAAGAAGDSAVGPTRSLRFNGNGNDDPYLERSVSSASNRRTFTFAAWVKNDYKPANDGRIFSAGTSTSNIFDITLSSSNEGSHLRIYNKTTTVHTNWNTVNVLRDVAGWIHITCSIDTTQSDIANRVKVYLNGVHITENGTTNTRPSQNAQMAVNDAVTHYIGRSGAYSGDRLAGYLADVYFIDGAQLDPTSFGAFDDNGVWRPATFDGNFGTNGFHLKFDDVSTASAIGADSSGNSNNFTPYNFVHASGVAAPGARSAAVLFDGTDDKISFTSNSDLNPGNGTFTLECFVYKLPGQQVVVYYGTGVGQAGFRVISNGKLGVERINTAFDLQTTGTVPEGQWVHVAWVKSGTTIKGWINGQDAGSATTSQTYQGTFVTGKALPSDAFNNMVISDLHLVKGTALYTSSFTPPTTISAHANTKLLCFQNASSATTATTKPSGVTLTASSSPVAGTYPINQPEEVDVLVDTPVNGDPTNDTGAGGELTSNYCVWNALDKNSGVTLSDGNLKAVCGTTEGVNGTIALPASGKIYFEIEFVSYNAAADTFAGLMYLDQSSGTRDVTAGGTRLMIRASGTILNNAGSSSATAIGAGDILGVACNCDSNSVQFYKNGSSIGSAQTPSPAFDGTSWAPYCSSSNGSCTFILNTGQRAFHTAAPTGYKALCAANLSTPGVDDGKDHFDAKLWTGNSSNGRTISGYEFSPDLVYIKRRNASYGGIIMDTVRGLNNGHAGVLYTNATNTEDTGATSSITSFNTDGFNLGTDGGVNYSGSTYVGWAWDCGSSTSSNTDGSITSQVRVSQSAGVSIIAYTGNGNSSGSTVGHGLGKKPEMLIIKSRDTGYSWIVWHSSFTAKQVIYLNHAMAIQNNKDDHFNNTLPTNSVFSLRESPAVNSNGDDFICYAFSRVEGHSDFGQYEGNSNADGPFIYTGFRVKFLMIKNITDDGWSWNVYDTVRDPANPNNKLLRPDISNAEIDAYAIDFLSNGFKIRWVDGAINNTGKYYIYCAFGESPFQTNGGLAR